jgi:hypothetical protein
MTDTPVMSYTAACDYVTKTVREAVALLEAAREVSNRIGGTEEFREETVNLFRTLEIIHDVTEWNSSNCYGEDPEWSSSSSDC